VNWPLVSLDKLAEFVGGSTPRREEPRNWGPGHYWATPTDLPMPGEGILDLVFTAQTITDEGLKSCSTNILPIGSVLYSTRATIGKIAISNVPVATNQGFNNLICGPEIYNRYLAYALQYLTPDISRLAGSTTFKEVSRSSLRGFKIPLPVLSEQHRIAEILQEADRLRLLSRDADIRAKGIMPAVFLKMFGAPENNPKAWPVKRLSEVATVISGATPRTENDNYFGGDILWATPKDLSVLDDYIICETATKLTNDGFDSCSTVMLPANSVLLSSRAPIGLVAINELPICTNQGFKSLIPKSQVNAWYLLGWITTANDYIKSQGRGATFMEISKTIVENLQIPIPERKLQDDFEKIMIMIRSTRISARDSRAKLIHLWQTIFQRAFSGQLTARWREENMLELLLELEKQAYALNLTNQNIDRAKFL